jgi:hypothetical protein
MVQIAILGMRYIDISEASVEIFSSESVGDWLLAEKPHPEKSETSFFLVQSSSTQNPTSIFKRTNFDDQ